MQETTWVLTLVELIWTITPAVILILIALPSFKLLYLMDEIYDPSMTILTEGLLCGLKLYILNKIKDAMYLYPSPPRGCVEVCAAKHGEKNNTLVSYKRLAQVKGAYLKRSNLIPLRNLKNYNALYFNKRFHTKVRASNRIGPHSEQVISVVIGSLLGDGYANARTIEGTRICYRQSDKHIDYLFWLYDFFYTKGYTRKNAIHLIPLKKNNSKYVIGLDLNPLSLYGFETFTFRSLNWISDMYIKKGKTYLSNKVASYLTPLALCVWVLSNGKVINGELNIDTCLCTNEDINKLKDILKIKFGLDSHYYRDKKSKYGICIEYNSIYTLNSLINPILISNSFIKKVEFLINFFKENSATSWGS